MACYSQSIVLLTFVWYNNRGQVKKSIVINVAYDTIEALGLKLESSNSMRGTLIVSDGRIRKNARRARLRREH
jgi:hypothetical protein